MTPLQAFAWLCNGGGDTGRADDDQDSRVGFCPHSEIHQLARIAGLECVEAQAAEGQERQMDLFAPPPPKLLQIVELETLPDEELFPKAYGGEVPDDALDWTSREPVEFGEAWAWDEREVLTPCPRGLCLIKRQQWAEGWRHCPGC